MKIVKKVLSKVEDYGSTILLGEMVILCFDTDSKFLKVWATVAAMMIGLRIDLTRLEVLDK